MYGQDRLALSPPASGPGLELPPVPYQGGWAPLHGQGSASALSSLSPIPHPQRGPGTGRSSLPHGLLPSVGCHLRAADRS